MWGEAIQLDLSSGLWYKFRQHSNGDWEILSSADKNSLEPDSVIYHDHHWQRDGKWYFQGKRGNSHTIGRGSFLKDLRRRNHNATLNLTENERQALALQNNSDTPLTERQIKLLADYRANQAYGSSGYVGNNHGIQVSSYDESGSVRLNRQIQEYQQKISKILAWRDSQIPSSQSLSPELNWRDDTSNTIQADSSDLSTTGAKLHRHNRNSVNTANKR